MDPPATLAGVHPSPSSSAAPSLPSPSRPHSQYSVSYPSPTTATHSAGVHPQISLAPGSVPAGQIGTPPDHSTTTPPSASTSTPRLRSSIACTRCRRSKIKCTNAGAGTTCEACAHSGRECVYPTPGSGLPKREQEHDEQSGPPKKPRTRNKGDQHDRISDPQVLKDAQIRPGRLHGQGAKETGSSLPGDGALDPTVLTLNVWTEIFQELFQHHFGTDLPFFHTPSFLPRLRSATASLTDSAISDAPDKTAREATPGWEMLLLGILALTARFHPGLVHHHCSGTGGGKDRNEVYASEYYAVALRSLLLVDRGEYIGQPTLSKIQALLMLAMHEWGMCKGIKAWIHVGVAVRMAQAMGLHYEDDLDVEPYALSSAVKVEAQQIGIVNPGDGKGGPVDPASPEAWIDEEMKRRTFWSCFIMDRYLSSEKFRPAMLAAGDVRLQLPCGERAWVFRERVCTGLLSGKCSGTGKNIKAKQRQYRKWKERAPAGSGDYSSSMEGVIGEGEKEDDDAADVPPCEYGSSEGLLSRIVKMVDIWGKIAKWSCAGGRRQVKIQALGTSMLTFTGRKNTLPGIRAPSSIS